ncbi:MAG TPA: hypothetical protein DDX91_06540 [Ruminococcaceae bacterium]|nr:hypothetical protein [Oscillospiraceae bacterium]
MCNFAECAAVSRKKRRNTKVFRSNLPLRDYRLHSLTQKASAVSENSYNDGFSDSPRLHIYILFNAPAKKHGAC